MNRIDEIVYFKPLGKETQKGIVEKLLNQLNDRLKESFYSFEFSDSLKDWILDSAYSPNFGARPLKRFIQNNVETVLATKIISGEVNTKDKYLVTLKDDKVVVEPLK